MALILKNSPVGVDKSIDTIQKALYTELVTNGTWTNYESYHRAYRNETKNGIKPEVFTGNGNDYADVYMDDKFTVTSFFLVDNETEIEEDMFTSDISVIFQVNLNKLYTTAPHRFDEEFRYQIVKIFRGLNGTFSFNSITTSIDGVYSGLDTEQVKLNDTHPCHVVRYELTANYTHACDNVFATGDCTIVVTVSVTDETTIGADDGTATANITGAQGNITYLWTTSNGNIPSGEEVKQTATGLSAGTYFVQVTDDNVLEPACTSSDSGTVAAGQPIPPCNISINSIVTVGTTGSTGTATATVSGNAGGVNFKWNGPNGYTSITNPATGIEAGEISLAVSDSGVGVTCIDSDCSEVPISNGNAISFKGDGDYVEMDSPVDFAINEDFTILFQFNTPDLSENFKVIFRGDNNPTSEYITFYGDDEIRFRFNTSAFSFDLPSAVSANTWQTIIITRRFNTVMLYQDALESASFYTNVTQAFDMRYINSAGFLTDYEGLMDNIHILRGTAASIQQIVDLNNDPSQFNTIMGSSDVAYNCNQTGATTTLIDTSGNSNNGDLIGLISEPFVPHV